MTVNRLERLKEQRNNIINAQHVLSAITHLPGFKTTFLQKDLEAITKLIEAESRNKKPD